MRITDLSKTEGDFTLQIDRMELAPGKIHGLVGHNGSGKTILLKCIMGILTPDRGTIDYEGLTPQDITLMSQRPYLLHASVYDNLVYPLKVRGQRPDEKEMDYLLERVGLLAQKNQYDRSLSSGERQKLSFLRAMVFGPKFVMMDETLSNMDPDSEAVILDLIRQTQDERLITWLIVNHQLEKKKELCDVMHRMEKGRYCGITEG